MRKYKNRIVISILLIVAFLVGCGKKDDNLKDNKYYKKVYNMFNYKLEGIMEENFYQ